MITRRNFLTRSAAVATGASLIAATPWKALAATALDWNDPAAWASGVIPGPSDIAVVSQAIQLTGAANVAGVLIEAGGDLIFDSAATVTLETTGNIEVHGSLTVKPSTTVTHTIRFLDVDESKFVGGGMDVLASDVGLWVRGSGQLDIAGSPKAAWNRTGDDVSWTSSDTLVVAPTAKGDYPKDRFDSFTKGSSVPTVNGTWTAEVLNLTRNVIIEGQPGERAHINIRSDAPQFVSHATLRHMGPTEPVDDDKSVGYIGRYPLHFHHCGDGSRGSIIDGVLVTESGNRAFVPHGSHGVTMKNCIAYNVQNSPYWWDFPEDGDGGASDSDDTVWEDNVAALVFPNDPIRGFELHGFAMGAGTGNIARRCVAVGILGSKNAAGYHWPSKANASDNIWVFEDCLAHNNARAGLFTWQTDSGVHPITRFDTYRCGFAGVIHGAYTNRYHYKDVRIHECDRGLEVHAKGPEDDKPPALTFENVVVSGATIADVVVAKHNADNEGVTEYQGGTIKTLLVDNASNSGTHPGTYQFIDTGLYPSGVTLGDVVAGTMVIGQNGDEQWQMDHTGAVTYLDADLSRAAGSDRYDTAATISREAFAPGVAVAYVATGENFPDALAAGAAGATLGGPVLLTNATTVPSATQTELDRLNPARIVVLGGTSIISKNAADTLGKYSPIVERIAGLD
ncbi:MAG: cell wall-binding repeat-containing protein, partial [Acidimicrobiia bacterium]|nr:cell wall-binding repeat-containing protein [Acidimicrobiia bacterium]